MKDDHSQSMRGEDREQLSPEEGKMHQTGEPKMSEPMGHH
jgi:hypothetical protein